MTGAGGSTSKVAHSHGWPVGAGWWWEATPSPGEPLLRLLSVLITYLAFGFYQSKEAKRVRAR